VHWLVCYLKLQNARCNDRDKQMCFPILAQHIIMGCWDSSWFVSCYLRCLKCLYLCLIFLYLLEKSQSISTHVMLFPLLATWLLTQHANKQPNWIIYIITVVDDVKNLLQIKCRGKKKGKALLVQAMKSRGSRGIAPLIPNHKKKSSHCPSDEGKGK